MLLVPRNADSMGSQDEWDAERSWRRIYCALSETLSDRKLKKLITEFVRSQGDFAGREDVERAVRAGALYAAVAFTLTKFPDGEIRWTAYIRKVYPVAPKKFEDIGRMANAPKNKQSEPPPRRINVKGPHHHSDDGTSILD